jgi:hypothetical protein
MAVTGLDWMAQKRWLICAARGNHPATGRGANRRKLADLQRMETNQQWRSQYAPRLKQLQKLFARKAGLLKNVAQRTLRYVTGVKGHNRSPSGMVLVPQEMVTTLYALNHKPLALQSGEQFARGDLRQPAHTRASFTGTISLIVLRGSASDFGSGQPLSW